MELPIQGAEILKMIPQRFPIVLVDSLYEYSSLSVKTGLLVSKDSLFVLEDVLQESGLLEHMAQSVALHTGYDYCVRNEKSPTGYIGSIQKVELYRMPRIGELIQTDVLIVQEFMGVTLVEIVSRVQQETIGVAQMKTVIATS